MNHGKATDAMLDKISELVAERNEALARLERIRTLVDGVEWSDASWRNSLKAVSRALPVLPATKEEGEKQ